MNKHELLDNEKRLVRQEKTTANTFHTARAPLSPRLFAQGTGRAYRYLGPGISGRCLVESRGTGGAFAAFELTVAPGAEMPLHVHTNEDETFYVLSGQFDIQRGNELFTLEKGMGLFGPRDVAHGFHNVGSAPGRLLVLTTPGALEDFYAALDNRCATLGSLHTAPARAAYGQLLEEFDLYPLMKTWAPLRRGAPGASGCIDLGSYRGQCLVTSEQTGGVFLLTDLTVDPNGGPPLHVHYEEDEALFLLSGQLEVLLGETRITMEPGDVFFGPRNVPHGWRNLTAEPVFGLRLVTPGENAYTFALEMQAFLTGCGKRTLTAVQDPALVQSMNALLLHHDLQAAVG